MLCAVRWLDGGPQHGRHGSMAYSGFRLVWPTSPLHSHRASDQQWQSNETESHGLHAVVLHVTYLVHSSRKPGTESPRLPKLIINLSGGRACASDSHQDTKRQAAPFRREPANRVQRSAPKPLAGAFFAAFWTLVFRAPAGRWPFALPAFGCLSARRSLPDSAV